MRTHIIENGKVVNTILATLEEAQTAYPDRTCVDAESGGGIGDNWDGAVFTTPSKYKTVKEAVVDKHTAINAIRDEKLAAGFPYVFPDAVSGTIQTRDLRDYINILGNVVAGILMSEQPIVMPFRDAEDLSHSLSPTETKTMGLSALSSYTSIYRVAWAHKDALKDLALGGATISEIEAYDITTGWPE